MSDKLRPPRLFYDKKGYYVIDGSKKKRINYGIDNKNVVNVVIENCRTKQKRKKTKKTLAAASAVPPLSVVKPPSIQEQVMNSRYKLNQILEQKLLAAKRQELRNREINLLSKTDNSLSALTKDGITATLSDQILGTSNAQPQKHEDKYDFIQEDPQHGDHAPQHGDQAEPYAEQLIAEETDTKANQPDNEIEVDQLGNPIIPGELEGPNIDNQPQMPGQADINVLFDEFLGKEKAFLNNREFTASEIIKLATLYGYQPGDEGKQDLNVSRKKAIDYLLDNADFVIKFIDTYEEDIQKIPPAYKMQTPTYQRVMATLMTGRGKNSIMTGLYNDQIDDMLREYPQYVGCFSRDEINKINLNDGIGGFVYNTVPSDKPTKYEGHWRAIYIDVDGDKSIDHYDSFGEPAELDIQEQVKQMLEPYNLPYYLKWKDNKIVNQRSNSSNCGWFCINFLQDRFEGIPFIDSTGFSTIMKSENKIKGLKKKFNYLI